LFRTGLQEIEESDQMTISIFAIGYIFLSVFAAVLFYCACVVGSWADKKQPKEIFVDYPTTRYQLDLRDLAEDPRG
jgi:hypothetical protein